MLRAKAGSAAALAALCVVAAAAPAHAAKSCQAPRGDWERATPAEEGMDAAKLQDAMDYGTSQLSFAVRVYRRGCLVAEDREALPQPHPDLRELVDGEVRHRIDLRPRDDARPDLAGRPGGRAVPGGRQAAWRHHHARPAHPDLGSALERLSRLQHLHDARPHPRRADPGDRPQAGDVLRVRPEPGLAAGGGDRAGDGQQDARRRPVLRPARALRPARNPGRPLVLEPRQRGQRRRLLGREHAPRRLRAPGRAHAPRRSVARAAPAFEALHRARRSRRRPPTAATRG